MADEQARVKGPQPGPSGVTRRNRDRLGVHSLPSLAFFRPQGPFWLCRRSGVVINYGLLMLDICSKVAKCCFAIGT